MSNILLLGQIFYKTDEELKIYEDYITNIKGFDYKIMIVDSSPHSKFNANICDYYLYDKENRLFNRDPINFLEYFIDGEVYKLTIFCQNKAEHELNILYQNTKAFNLAKTLGYEYILRLECDATLYPDDINILKDRINECLTNKKLGIFSLHDHVGMMDLHVSFWNIDLYLQNLGNILNQDDWYNLLKSKGIENPGIEKAFYEIFTKSPDNYLILNSGLRTLYRKGFRYQETKRFHDSDVIIDFFKNNNLIYFCVNNLSLSKFPSKVILTQNTPTGILTNGFADPGRSLHWVAIFPDIISVDLEIENDKYTLTHDELFSTQNKLEFINNS